MRALARAAASLAVLAGLVACATDYVSPEPGSAPTALITVQIQTRVHLNGSPLTGTSSSFLGIYSADGPCDPTTGDMDAAYRGSLNVSQPEREFRVVAERPVFFQFSYLESGEGMAVRGLTATCTIPFGFLPHADQSYTLMFHFAHATCGVDVMQADVPVEVLHPSDCFATGWSAFSPTTR